jgi:hypothetical protein
LAPLQADREPGVASPAAGSALDAKKRAPLPLQWHRPSAEDLGNLKSMLLALK